MSLRKAARGRKERGMAKGRKEGKGEENGVTGAEAGEKGKAEGEGEGMSIKATGKREAAVAGSFYPNSRERLEKILDDAIALAKPETKGAKTNCIIAPHAGYVYSAKTAAFAFSVLEKCSTYIILCPNHTGFGTDISVYSYGSWEMPLGELQVDAEFAGEIMGSLNLEHDESAHMQEHAIEVQLPFLQHAFGNGIKIVPVCIAVHDRGKLKELGSAIASAEARLKRKIGVIASSDFSHFVPEENAREKDFEAIEFIKKLDIDGFDRIVNEKRLSICGCAAIESAMQYAKLKGKKEARLLHYSTSADSTGDKASVVGYAALGFF